MVTEDSTVYYNRSIMGTFTVKLKVVAEWEQAALAAGKGIVQKTGHFSGSLKLQGGSGGWGWGVGGAGSVLLVPRPHQPLVKGTRHAGLPQSSAWGGKHRNPLSLAFARGELTQPRPGSPETSVLSHQV